jgi:RNA polymerase sigma factor (sigma-70 family)
MKPRSLNDVLHDLRGAMLRHEAEGRTDGQLLEAFLTRREEAAFAMLVRRHGPMVFGVCRRILGHREDAEDAFQATFLVLLRKGDSIRPRQAVGPWLYGVAYRTALRAREASARRRLKELRAGQSCREEVPPSEADWRPLLDEELSRLPEKYRAPIVLCDLQGRTHREAAGELGWPQGTLSGRLWRARELLARRLTRRGLTLSATVLTLACAEDAAFATVAAPLVREATRIARLFIEGGSAAANGVPARVAGLTQGVLRTMWMTKARMAMAAMLAAGFSAGAFLYAARPIAGGEEPITAAEEQKPAPNVRKSEVRFDEGVPTVEALIAYLNRNARRIPALRCTNCTLDVRHERVGVGLAGYMVCERPNRVRFIAKVLGQPAIDLGSNEQEYWLWSSQAEPQSLFRSDRTGEPVKNRRGWPLIYKPDWLLDILGMAEYDPARIDSLRLTKQHLELTETIRSPQGQLVRKVIVLHRSERFSPQSQIAAILFKDAEDNLLLRADIKRGFVDKETGARLTREAVITFPCEHLEVRLGFNDFRIEPLAPGRSTALFSPQSLFVMEPMHHRLESKEQAAATPSISIELTNDRIKLRCRDEVLSFSGRPDSALALRALHDQLHTWTEKDQQLGLCITCPASAEYSSLKAVLDTCRQAGIRKIEVRTKDKSDKE